MPATEFYCLDREKIKITDCFKKCRMGSRCATLPYLRLISHQREWTGKISPSRAGTGARKIWLEQITDYAISPDGMAWASMGTATHDKLSFYKYTDNVLSEELLSDEAMKGIADVLEEDEKQKGQYVLYDYKNWGSYKLCKALGLVQIDKPCLDKDGNEILYKSGEKKGQVKTYKETFHDPDKIDLRSEIFQLNRYRIFFKQAGFPISRQIIQAIPRDGNTFIAKNRGIDKNIYLIDVPIIADEQCLGYYNNLQREVDFAFEKNWIPKCRDWESWEGRRCCQQYCEVFEACQKIDKGGN